MRAIQWLVMGWMCMQCSASPEPIQYGVDVCHACKMMAMDQKFGAEIVTAKGKVYKFDDINCMVNFLNTELKDEVIAHTLVADFSHPGELLLTQDARFLYSPEIKSPMSSHVAAFREAHDHETFKDHWSAETLTWDDIISRWD